MSCNPFGTPPHASVIHHQTKKFPIKFWNPINNQTSEINEWERRMCTVFPAPRDRREAQWRSLKPLKRTIWVLKCVWQCYVGAFGRGLRTVVAIQSAKPWKDPNLEDWKVLVPAARAQGKREKVRLKFSPFFYMERETSWWPKLLGDSTFTHSSL